MSDKAAAEVVWPATGVFPRKNSYRYCHDLPWHFLSRLLCLLNDCYDISLVQFSTYTEGTQENLRRQGQEFLLDKSGSDNMNQELSGAKLSFSDAARLHDAFLSRRAYDEGAAAFLSGLPKAPPSHLGDYSGSWVQGWAETCFTVGSRPTSYQSPLVDRLPPAPACSSDALSTSVKREGHL